MIDLLANLSFGAMLAFGLLLIGGFLLIANSRDPRNARHPGGARGRVVDELIVLGPVVVLLVMITGGAAAPTLRDASWWLPVLFGIGVAGAVLSFSPPVRRARRRLEALRGGPAQ